MKLNQIAEINAGHVTRGAIEPRPDGTHLLIQGKDVDGHRYTYETGGLVRFTPALRKSDQILKPDDILFMARGARNYAIHLGDIPAKVLAAGSFYSIRIKEDMVEKAIPTYLSWYLNQERTREYFSRFSGQGVAMPLVRRNVLENLEVPLPDPKIQDSIAQLDGLMRHEKDLLEKLVEKRERLISALCMKQVDKV